MAQDHVTRYEVMPIPPVDAQTEYFHAGALSFGVEYRLLTDAVAAANTVERAAGDAAGITENVNDRGVAIHVFGDQDGEQLEVLRFDCFQEDPHYHYISWKDRQNHMVHLDPVADGDPVEWALERIRTRLPQMLARAGAAELAARVDARAVEEILPRLTEAAYRARFHSDERSVLAAALGSGSR
jgi:hypothetical protein